MPMGKKTIEATTLHESMSSISAASSCLYLLPSLYRLLLKWQIWNKTVPVKAVRCIDEILI